MPTFPPGFRFGAATAAYQVEGAVHEDGRRDSIWDTFCHIPGAIDNGDTGDVACDHYHRFEQDLDLMAELGLESYRFSIAWPRVQPDGTGPLNPAGVSFYRRLVEGLLERGIEPIATLYHWDLPQALQDAGGWAERDTAQRFAEYAQHMARELGDVVETWITHNEPWVVAVLGHVEGRFAPGVRDWATGLTVAHHLLLSHGLAVDVLPGKVGITLNLSPSHPAGAGDGGAALIFDGHVNRWFLDPVFRGRYPDDMVELYEQRVGALDVVRDGDLDVIARPVDFLGVNYYFVTRVRDDPEAGPLGASMVPGRPPTTAMGWEVDPSGLHDLLVRLHREYGAPVLYVTENGAAYDDPPPSDGLVADPQRQAYLEGHIDAVARAIEDGADVRRYLAWSLLDNFEWASGYAKRFGIVHVDYATQRRTLKASGAWYRDLIARTRHARLHA
ncbi:MAG TPA: GH1 family beta-glucosidase [Solirubrobacteraceae bacterium]